MFLRKLVLFTFFVFILLLSFSVICPQEASGAQLEVMKVVRKLSSLQSFRANITFTRPSGAEEAGSLSYEKGKLYLRLRDGRVLAANNLNIVAYNPGFDVAARQPIDKLSGGLGWLLDGIAYEASNGGARGVPTRVGSRIQEIFVSWNSEYQLRRLSILNKGTDKWLHITLSELREAVGFPPTLFSFRAPTGSRTVENALNRKKN